MQKFLIRLVVTALVVVTGIMLSMLLHAAIASADAEKVTICHYDRNETGPNAGPHTIEVAAQAVDGHLRNHTRTNDYMGDDSLGACPEPTATATPTATETPVDPTATPTAEPSATDTASPTATSTPRKHATRTATATPAVTDTSTAVPSATPTNTPDTTLTGEISTPSISFPNTGSGGDKAREPAHLPTTAGFLIVWLSSLTAGLILGYLAGRSY